MSNMNTASALSALHTELASRLVVFLEGSSPPSPLLPFLETAVKVIRSVQLVLFVCVCVCGFFFFPSFFYVTCHTRFCFLLLFCLFQGSRASDEAAQLVSSLLRQGASAELSSAAADASCAAAALFHFLGLVAPLCPSSYDLMMLGAGLPSRPERLAFLSDAVASLDLLLADLVALFARWSAAEPDTLMHTAALLAPFLLRPRDPTAVYLANDDINNCVAQMLLSSTSPSPKTLVQYSD